MPDKPTQPRKKTDNILQGSPDNIEYRLVHLEGDRDKTEKALWGTDGNIGMVGRLSKVEDIIGDMKKLLWAILGVVIGIAAGGIWQAIAHAIASAPAR